VRHFAREVERLTAEVVRLQGQRETLSRERDSLAAHLKALDEELTSAETAREKLAAERSELRAHAQRLEAEREEANARLRREKQNLECLVQQRAPLMAERDSLLEHVARLEEEARGAWKERDKWESHWLRMERLLPAPPGHFYSPIVDPADPHVIAASTGRTERAVAGAAFLRLDETAMLDWLVRLAGHYPAIPFPAGKSPGFRYYLENPSFSYGDAITLCGMMLEFRPRRIVEVGAGYSSCAIMDVNDRLLDGSCEITVIDPFPETLLGLLDTQDSYRERIEPRHLQDVPIELFEALEGNDILFIDSSHVLKTASDVNHYLFRILPVLRPGVLVHLHDIFYPFEYKEEWVLQETRSWNEAYALHAFLLYNDVFEVLYFNDLLRNRHQELLRRYMPDFLRNSGSSIWLRKLSTLSV
jgi:Methyltransferase domain